jgi:DNA-binding response OmpR family regulator
MERGLEGFRVADGRVIVVHNTSSVRAHLAELLTREGYSVESIDSTYRCVARAVDDPADLVVIGLSGLADVELELIPALRQEENPPRILVSFPQSLREMAARALSMGADGYLLEPFYADELKRIAATLLAPAPAPEAAPATPARPSPEALQRLAHEVTHAINNPLQIVRLLLDKKNVTKKEIEDGLPPQLERIDQVLELLRDFGAVGPGQPRRVPAGPPAQRAAEATGVKLEAGDVPAARVDEANYTTALTALFQAVQRRVTTSLVAQQSASGGEITVRLTIAADAFGPEELDALAESVFVVGPEREILPGLALSRMLLEDAGGRLEVRRSASEVTFRAIVPAA